MPILGVYILPDLSRYFGPSEGCGAVNAVEEKGDPESPSAIRTQFLVPAQQRCPELGLERLGGCHLIPVTLSVSLAAQGIEVTSMHWVPRI